MGCIGQKVLAGLPPVMATPLYLVTEDVGSGGGSEKDARDHGLSCVNKQ